MAKERMLGIVREGRLWRLTPIRDLGAGCRLTQAPAGAGVEGEGAAAGAAAGNAETSEIRLDRYEGSAILVEGEPHELWIHEAVVIEEATPIVTELVQYVLGHAPAAINPRPEEAL